MSRKSEKPASTASTPEIMREKNSGHFLPGVSGNPGGRPRTSHISEALRQKLDSELDDGTGRTYAQAIADRACNAAAFAKRESQAVQAAEFIADRTEGKALQSVRVQHIDESTIKHIVDLYARLIGDDVSTDIGYQFPHSAPDAYPTRALPDVSQATVLDAKTALSDSAQPSGQNSPR